MSSTLRLDGFDEFLADLDRLMPDLTAEVAPLQATIAAQTADELRAAYPVVTGRLRASVQVERLSDRGPGRVASNVVATAPYAPHVEFGTRYVRARPTFIPITRRGRQAFVRAVIDRVRERGLQVTGDAA